MSFPVKSHLPLITPRIQYEFNTLPPPPQITPCKNHAADIRCQARRKVSPYVRFRRPHKGSPFRAQPSRSDLHSESSLSELSDSEDSNQENSVDIADKIPKPAGEAGRANSGGYNLEQALGWNPGRFAEFTAYISEEIAAKLDVKKCYSKQKSNVLDEIIQQVADKFNVKNMYANDWPIRDALKLRLKYTSDFEKRKAHKKVEKNLKNVLNTSNSSGDKDN